MNRSDLHDGPRCVGFACLPVAQAARVAVIPTTTHPWTVIAAIIAVAQLITVAAGLTRDNRRRGPLRTSLRSSGETRDCCSREPSIRPLAANVRLKAEKLCRAGDGHRDSRAGGCCGCCDPAAQLPRQRLDDARAEAASRGCVSQMCADPQAT